MADYNAPVPFGGGQQGAAGLNDVINKLDGIVKQLSAGNSNFAIFMSGFPRSFGVFTLSAAADTVVPLSTVESNSRILWNPSNAAGATLMGSAQSLYLSARSPGVSFTVSTANAVAAAGTESFFFILFNPA